jgi:hypothetical protein
MIAQTTSHSTRASRKMLRANPSPLAVVDQHAEPGKSIQIQTLCCRFTWCIWCIDRTLAWRLDMVRSPMQNRSFSKKGKSTFDSPQPILQSKRCSTWCDTCPARPWSWPGKLCSLCTPWCASSPLDHKCRCYKTVKHLQVER